MNLLLILGIAGLFVDPEFCGVVRGARYAEIHIVGNTDTPRRAIVSMLDIEPGAKIELGKLQAAEKRLRECPTIQTNLKKGIVPTVELEPNKESQYWDVIIRVTDTPGSWLGYELVDLTRYSIQAVIFRDRWAALGAFGTARYIVERVSR